MILDGSCHCRRVTFRLTSAHPYPYNICYCSICRKTQGGAGAAINLSGDFQSLKVTGRENLSVYRATLPDGSESPAERSFCHICSSGLWVWDPRWPDLVHPFASAIDTELPVPPATTHLMLGSKAGWVPVHATAKDRQFPDYPDESIAEWHERHDLVE